LLAPGLVNTRSEYAHLFAIYVPIALGVFVVIVVVVAVAVARYRRRPPEQAARWHEHNRVEGGYAVLLALTVAFLLYVTFSAEHQVDTVANHERPAVTIDVSAGKWEWTFTYPAYGFSVHSGTVGHQPFVVPTNEPVRFNLTSVDVIHALWLPELRYKHDLIPGSTQVATLDFPTAGTFGGQCAEFCGLRHPEMVFTAIATSPARFAAWARGKGRGSTP
jgi:cytochrome c oxidase subunit 2